MKTLTSVNGEYVRRFTDQFEITARPGEVVVESAELRTDGQLTEFVTALHQSARDARSLKPGKRHKPAAPPRTLNNGAWPALETK